MEPQGQQSFNQNRLAASTMVDDQHCCLARAFLRAVAPPKGHGRKGAKQSHVVGGSACAATPPDEQPHNPVEGEWAMVLERQSNW